MRHDRVDEGVRFDAKGTRAISRALHALAATLAAMSAASALGSAAAWLRIGGDRSEFSAMYAVELVLSGAWAFVCLTWGGGTFQLVAVVLGVLAAVAGKLIANFIGFALGEPPTYPTHGLELWVAVEPALALSYTTLRLAWSPRRLDASGSRRQAREWSRTLAAWLLAIAVSAVALAPDAWARAIPAGSAIFAVVSLWPALRRLPRSTLGWVAGSLVVSAGVVASCQRLLAGDLHDVVPMAIARNCDHCSFARIKSYEIDDLDLWSMKRYDVDRTVEGWDSSRREVVRGEALFRRVRERRPLALAQIAADVLLDGATVVGNAGTQAPPFVQPPHIAGNTLVFWTSGNGEPDGPSLERHDLELPR